MDYDKSYGFFCRMVDDLVELSEFDDELAERIEIIDENAQKQNITFYDAVFEVLYKHDPHQTYAEWFNTRN